MTPSLLKAGKIAISVVLFLAIVALIISKCNQQKTNLNITDVKHSAQTITTEQLNDSLKYAEQTVLLAETNRQMRYLQTTLQAELLKKTKIEKATATIEYKDRIVYVNIPGENSEYIAVDTTVPENQVVFPLKFTHTSKFMKLSYRITSKNNSILDSLKIINTGHLIVGEKGKWYQKKTIIAAMVNENPYYIVNSMKSVVYKPKTKTQLSIGPILLTNGKTVSAGTGVVIKKGIFSLSIGYKLF